jgi:hypothetical protein
MVNIQFWLTYHPYYGENNKIGLALMQAQTNQIAVAPHQLKKEVDAQVINKEPMLTKIYLLT